MSHAPPTARQWLQEARTRLQNAGLVDDADREARHLLESASGISTLQWWADPERRLAEQIVARLEAMLIRRTAREPLAYIEQRASFYGREFFVERGVLVPREDSAALIELALDMVPASPAICVDVGVGSGCLLTTLLLERTAWRGCGIDLDGQALRCTRRNLNHYELGSRSQLWRGDLLGALSLGSDVALILSNPPYVTPSEWRACEPEVRLYEPRLALLVPEHDPLQPYRRLMEAWQQQRRGSVLICEVGAGRAEEVAALFRRGGASLVQLRADLGGVPRAVGAVI